jgi:hypothetical protein
MSTKIYKRKNNGIWKLPNLSVVLLFSVMFAINTVHAQLVITPTVTNVACAGDQSGSIFISVSGGSGIYTFLWSNSATSQNLPHVFAGTYSVTVTDVGSVTASSTSTVTQPVNLPQFAADIQNVSCFGQCNGMISVTPNGGTPGYTYHWQDGTTQQNLTNVCAGLYFLTVTDNNGCRAISNNFVAQPPSALVVVPTPNIVPCGSSSGGSITLSVSGGFGSYSFLWNTGATTQNLTNVPAGTYTVTVNDKWPCFITTSATIQSSAAISVTNTVTNVKCAGDQSGSISITVTGGVAPFSYHWSNSVTTQNLGPAFAGTYSVTVTDVNGCTGVTSATITQPLNLPQFAATITNIACYGNCNGAISVTPNGGTPGYTYHWQDGTTQQNLNNVCAGLYFLTVTDANGCRAISNNFVAQPQAPLTVAKTVTNINCNSTSGGAITLTVTGGTVPYKYKWSNGATTQNISGLAAGTYTATVTDAGPCSTVTSGTVSGGTGGLTCDIAAVPCSNTYTGGVPTTIYIGYGPQSVTLNSTVNPTGVYNYTWTPSTGLSCTHCADPVFTPTKAGNYTFDVTISNNSGCSTTCEITICVLDIRANYGCGGGYGWYGPVAQNEVSPVGNNTDGGFWGGGCGNRCDYDLYSYVYLCHHYRSHGCNYDQNIIVRGCNVDNYIPCFPNDHLGKCDQDCSDNNPKDGQIIDAILDGTMKVDIYPNPFTYDVTVNVETSVDEIIWMEIFDMTGRSVKRINDVMPFQAVQFGNDLPGGLYIVKVHQGDRTETARIIKNK